MEAMSTWYCFGIDIAMFSALMKRNVMPFTKSLQKVYISCAERIWSLNGLCKLALAGNLLTVPPTVTYRFAMACGKRTI